MADEPVKRCLLCNEETAHPVLFAAVGQEVVGCICDRHELGADPFTQAPAIINTLIVTLGLRHPDQRIRFRDSTGRFIHPRTHH